MTPQTTDLAYNYTFALILCEQILVHPTKKNPAIFHNWAHGWGHKIQQCKLELHECQVPILFRMLTLMNDVALIGNDTCTSVSQLLTTLDIYALDSMVASIILMNGHTVFVCIMQDPDLEKPSMLFDFQTWMKSMDPHREFEAKIQKFYDARHYLQVWTFALHERLRKIKE